jgi:predicted amidophosphoribosyltransferase
LNEHAPAIQAQAAVDQAREQARNHDQMQGLDISKPLAAPGTLRCSKCQTVLTSGARFCPSCGTPAAPAQPAKQFCSGCGQPLAPGARFCAGCGTPSAT